MAEAGTGEPVARGSSGWRAVALLAAVVVGVLAVAVLAGTARNLPAGSPPPATIEPWPSSPDPAATATTGEIALGRVAVATAFGEPALLVRVSPGSTAAVGSVGVTIELRVIGPLDRPVGVDRFLLVRDGRSEPPGLGVTGADPLAIPADAPAGTEAAATFSFPVDEKENVDLAYAGSGTAITFRYPIHRAPSVPPSVGRCPTLEDYALASLQPSATPAPPSFEPVAPGATPSTGMLEPGETGILPAPDGSPGALVRVSNIRFCDRLPDYRPDSMGGPASLLLADVEIRVLERGVLGRGFIPGQTAVVASYGGRFNLLGALVFGMPGWNGTTSLDPAPGFAYRGTMAWEVPESDVRVTIDAQRPESDANGVRPVQVSWLARDGSAYVPWTPAPSSDPAATPTTGTVRPGESIVLAADGGTIPVTVGRVDIVPRYPGLVPDAPAAAFMEIPLVFGPASGAFSFVPEDWVVAGPDGGALPLVQLPSSRSGNDGLPNLMPVSGTVEMRPELPELPLWLIAQVPASGRVTLEYRPAGGPATVSWVLRE